MNQILQVKTGEKQNKSSKLKELISFLVIFMIIFGCIIGAYSIYQKIVNNSLEVPENLPVITLTQTEDNKVTIIAESTLGLSSITYKLNDADEETIQLNETTKLEKVIDLSLGENLVYVSVTDINGKAAQKQETYLIEAPKPIIELSVVGNDIKITVTSEIELKEITYAWNNENEKRENMLTYENRMQFEKKISIPIGKNTLKITAVDIDGSLSEKVQEIKGVTKAKTTVTVNGQYWSFKVVGKENIKSVEFEFNGKKYLMSTNTFGETKVVNYTVKLENGKNTLKITSTTDSDGVDTTSWEQEYTGQ